LLIALTSEKSSGEDREDGKVSGLHSSRSSWSTFPEAYPARVAACVLEFDDQGCIPVGPKPFAPLDDGDSFTADKVFQSDGTQLALSAQTIKIHMINRASPLVDIYQRKRRAVD
jgi:hypothetical protein